MNPYLNGEMYWIQLNHFGMLALFLKKPPKTINGRTRTGIAKFTPFSSLSKEPISNPIDVPVKDIKNKMRYIVKNC